MIAPDVCTVPATHGRIVSKSFAPLGSTPGPTAPFLDGFYSVPSPVAVCKDSSVLIPPAATTSSRNSVEWPSAKTPQSFRLSFVLFAFFAVKHLFKSAFRNSLRAYETPVYRHCFSRQRTVIKWAPKLQDLGSQLLEIITFEISLHLMALTSLLRQSPVRRAQRANLSSLNPLSRSKIPVPVTQDLYKIYKFTQNHTITFQLCTAGNHLHPNKLPNKNQQKTHPLPHPHVQKPIRQKPISNFPIRNPHSAIASVFMKGPGIGLYRKLSPLKFPQLGPKLWFRLSLGERSG
jgi:hypothetical protein